MVTLTDAVLCLISLCAAVRGNCQPSVLGPYLMAMGFLKTITHSFIPLSHIRYVCMYVYIYIYI